jgi:predicted nucleic acid-binding protein
LKTTADTSVLVASFASWHEHHAAALAAMARVNVVVGHCLIEVYSVLTRLPAPHRMTPEVVAAQLRMSFQRHEVIALSASDQRSLVATCASQGIGGGAVYDAAIAATALKARARLLTLDGRARPTYALLGVDVELLG